MNAHKVEILSIDITNQCHKECPFCYNASKSDNIGGWSVDEVIGFATDCIKSGVKSVSIGGGEPFEHPGIFSIIQSLYPLTYLTVTTNGLPLLDKSVMDRLKEVHPDKIHISVHNPESHDEVERVVSQLRRLESIGVKPGVNLLVSDKNVTAAEGAYKRLLEILTPSEIIILPMRYRDAPSPKDLLKVAGNQPFQSASCLTGCRMPANFVSVSWDKKASRCSFSKSKKKLASLTFQGMIDAISSEEFVGCGQ